MKFGMVDKVKFLMLENVAHDGCGHEFFACEKEHFEGLDRPCPVCCPDFPSAENVDTCLKIGDPSVNKTTFICDSCTEERQRFAEMECAA